MNAWATFGIGASTALGAVILYGLIEQRSAMKEATTAYARVGAEPEPPKVRFGPEHVSELPEIAQRYFKHAIAPETPIYSVVELQMEGTFLLGDKAKFQTYSMSAREVLRPPDQFVWMPQLRSGALTISGSDGLARGEAWTRFWLFRLIPVVQEENYPDLVRSAKFRALGESALWMPSSLLPQNGVKWEQLGPADATVTFTRFDPAITLQLSIDASGAVKEFVGQRWSNANPDKTFRLQPFGGKVLAEGSFQGLTIPTQVKLGNHFGTEDYLPFFQARVVGAKYR